MSNKPVFVCEDCDKEISHNVWDYSISNYDTRALCEDCQKNHKQCILSTDPETMCANCWNIVDQIKHETVGGLN